MERLPGVRPIPLKQFSVVPNVGDLISSCVVSHLASRPVDVIGEATSETPNLIAVGSILHWADQNSTIWGTGFICGGMVLKARPKAVLAVRGRLTWQELNKQGIGSPEVFGDPGIFVKELFPKQKSNCALGVVPHYKDRGHPFIQLGAASGARIIDVAAPPPQFFSALSSCERVLSSCLHGLIFAHAYGIPAAWIRLSDYVHGNGFKFFDYYSSIGIARSDTPVLTPSEKLEVLAERCHLPASPIDASTLHSALLHGLREGGLG